MVFTFLEFALNLLIFEKCLSVEFPLISIDFPLDAISHILVILPKARANIIAVFDSESVEAIIRSHHSFVELSIVINGSHDSIRSSELIYLPLNFESLWAIFYQYEVCFYLWIWKSKQFFQKQLIEVHLLVNSHIFWKARSIYI